VDIYTISRIAGHTRPELTMKYYIAVPQEKLLGQIRSAMERTANNAK
jgi:hypothetical protein